MPTLPRRSPGTLQGTQCEHPRYVLDESTQPRLAVSFLKDEPFLSEVLVQTFSLNPQIHLYFASLLSAASKAISRRLTEEMVIGAAADGLASERSVSLTLLAPP